MKWFTGTFLPSLDSKFGGKTDIWISEKQVNICRKYMKASNYYSFLYIVVGEYQYTLSIMKGGYGRLTKQDKTVAYH